MAAKLSHISNPLTIIGIFASLAEVGGAITLPNVSLENQIVFVWFLTLFPTFLVTLFFLVMCFRPQSLYSPSDFRSDESFLTSSFRAATATEIETKVGRDSVFFDAEEATVKDKIATRLGRKIEDFPANQERKNTLYEPLELEAIDWASDLLSMPELKKNRNIVIGVGQKSTVLDAAYDDGLTLHIVEAKYFKGKLDLDYMVSVIEQRQNEIVSIMMGYHTIRRCHLHFVVMSSWYAFYYKDSVEVIKDINRRLNTLRSPRVEASFNIYTVS